MSSPRTVRLDEIGQAILEARADQPAADLAGDVKRAEQHEATVNRAVEYWAAVNAGHDTVKGSR